MSGSNGALVLFSGGQDSATCLAWALDRFERVETLGFDDGQRHRVELDCRTGLRAGLVADFPAWSASRLGEDHTLRLDALAEVSDTALAYRRGLRHIVGGMCETDFSGYPDCRDDTIKALQVALNLGMERRFVLHTPLMWIDKAATWKLAADLGGAAFVDRIREEAHTCYLGDRTHCHEWGYGCGECPVWELRRKGWSEFVANERQAQATESADV